MTEVAARRMPMTVSDDRAVADTQPRQRSALLAGLAVAMVPRTPRHALIAGEVDAASRSKVRDPCCQSREDASVSTGDDSEVFTEPDVMVCCGPMDGRRRQRRLAPGAAEAPGAALPLSLVCDDVTFE